jgi:hypothetical protein
VAGKVVSEIFDAINKKAYKPGYVASPPVTKPKLRPSATEFNPTATSFSRVPPTGPSNGASKSKKRGFNEVANDDNLRNGVGNRALKQPRRQNANVQPGMVPTMPAAMVATAQGFGQQQMAFPGMPPFDPNDPVSMMMAMQAMMQAMATFSATMGIAPVLPPGMNTQRAGRCRDYDTVGFCAKGSACPYEHGEDKIVVQTEPNSSNPFANPNPFPHPPSKRREKKRTSSQTREKRGRKAKNEKRSDFSTIGDTTDPTNTKLVVENIPRDHLSENAVQSFFEQFGEVENVELLSSRRVAIVKFSDHEMARQAWRSPKAIFDSRFVRVFWHKSDYEMEEANFHNGDALMEEVEVDPVELERRIEEAQKAHEEKMKRLEEVRTQREELERKIKEHAQERKKLMQALRAKEKQRAGEDGDVGSDISEEDFELRNKLIALEAEAELLGLDPSDPYSLGSSFGGYRGRGRGGYRGRGRGRGQYSRGGGRGGVLRLDNRTKSITISIASGSEEDEKMRQLILVSVFLCHLTPLNSRS